MVSTLYRIAWMVVLILWVGIFASMCVAEAQNPTTLSLTPGIGGDPATKFTFKCGSIQGGPYPLMSTVAAPTMSISISNITTLKGTYFCISTASNDAGESGNSNEVSFQLKTTAPSTPSLIVK